MRFDLIDLALYVNVVEAGSITAGAARSSIALAAASTRIRLLEERLGTILLERSRKGVQATPAGQTLLRHARAILAQASRLEGDMGEFAGGLRGTVRLLSNTNALAEFLPRALGTFLVRHPEISVDLREKLSLEIVQAIVAEEADIGIVAGTVDIAGLHSYPFHTDRLVLVVPAGHPLPSDEPASFPTLLDAGFVGLQEASAIQSFLADLAARAGRRLKLRMKLSSFEGVCQMVETGAGLAIVPETAARRCTRTMDIRIVPLAEAWAIRDLRLCVRDPAALPSHARILLDHLRQGGANAGGTAP